MKNMKRRLLSCGLAAAMVLSCSVTGYAVEVDSYVDIPDDYSTDALIAAIDNGLLLGDNNQINPDGALTRGEFAAIMVRAFGATVEADISAYADVSETAWYAEYLAKAVAMGVLEGDGAPT